MLPELECLVHLQRAESELKRAESELAQLPRRRTEIDARLARERTRLEAARESLASTTKNRRQHESEVQSLEVKRSKYRGQLMEVKTNKEYTAMLHEIEAVEHEIRGREDQILAEMERGEALQAEIRTEEQAVREAETQHQAETRTLDDETRRLTELVARHKAARAEVAATVPENLLELFQRVARLRGTGLSEARDGMCDACRVKLRLQLYADLKHNDLVVQCPSCSRILYYEPPVPVTVAEP